MTDLADNPLLQRWDAPFGLPFRPTEFYGEVTLGFPGVQGGPAVEEVFAAMPVQYRYSGDIFSGAAKLVTADNYVEVMGSTVKVSNSQSLFASTSLVTGLYTNTLVTTKPSKTSGGTNTSTATATACCCASIGGEPVSSSHGPLWGC